MQKVFKNPNDLGLHPLLKTQPWMCAAELESLRASVRENGVLQDLFITADGDVVDGRHRWKAAVLEHVPEVPCVIVPEDQVASIVLATILERRHYTKSARAYLSLPLLEKAVSEGIQRRAAIGKTNIKHQKTDSVGLLSGPASKRGSDDLAERLGISTDMLQLARNTARLFADSDARRQKWLEANPDEAESFQAWVDDRPTTALPWACWRTERLKDMGENAADPKTVRLIPEDYREAYEDLLFSGEMGLGQINKAVGSALATKGDVRTDLNKQNPALFLTLGNKLKSFTATMFGDSWKDLSADHRLDLATKVAQSVELWPDEAQRATYQQLKALYAK